MESYISIAHNTHTQFPLAYLLHNRLWFIKLPQYELLISRSEWYKVFSVCANTHTDSFLIPYFLNHHTRLYCIYTTFGLFQHVAYTQYINKPSEKPIKLGIKCICFVSWYCKFSHFSYSYNNIMRSIFSSIMLPILPSHIVIFVRFLCAKGVRSYIIRI